MKKKLAIFVMFMFLFIPCTVFAAGENAGDGNQQEDLECAGGQIYEITKRGSKVSKGSITSQEHIDYRSILGKNYFELKQLSSLDPLKKAEFNQKYPNTNEADYAFEYRSKYAPCTVYTTRYGTKGWMSCPTKDQRDGNYSASGIQKAITEFKFDQGTGRFYMDIKDVFNNTVTVRVVRGNGYQNKDYVSFNTLLESGRIANGERQDLNSSLRLYFSQGENVRFEFYIRPGLNIECTDSFIGSLDTTAPTYAEVDNTWKDSAICKSFKNGYPSIPTTPKNYKSILVPECYKDKVEYFSVFRNISEASIRNKIAAAESLFSSAAEKDISKLQCHYHSDGSTEYADSTKTFAYNPGGSSGSASGTDYWSAICTEKVIINYDQPKKLIAGAGFTYKATLTVERECTPQLDNKVPNPPKCEYSRECWGGPLNHNGTPDAGPNEDFDSCVNTCDGGKYTKNCVNQCYKIVYENEDASSINSSGTNSLSGMNNFMDVIKAKQMNVVNGFDCGDAPVAWKTPNFCYQANNWPTTYNEVLQADGSYGNKTGTGKIAFELSAVHNNEGNCIGTRCTTFHGIQFNYLDICNGGTVCLEVYLSKPMPECSDTPELDVTTEYQFAKNEYDALIKSLSTYDETEEFEMSIIDSYKTDGSGNKLKTTSSSRDNMVKKTLVSKVDGDQAVLTPNEVVSYTENPSPYTQQTYKVKVSKTYDIELPQAVINRLTGAEKYVNQSYKIKDDERDGGNKYYTDINSGTFNDFHRWYENYDPTQDSPDRPFVGNNIGVVFSKVGTQQSSDKYTWNEINLDCFYGLLNKRYIECDDGICDIPCEENDVCTGGLQYMFRQIDTTKMFPERDPRWNWQYKSLLKDAYGYESNPQKVIDEVQALGDNVYSDENLDYDITITRNNIRSIRKYNKDLKNYQNNKMDCHKLEGSEIQVCESNMFKDTNLVNTFKRNTDLGSND